MSCRLHRTPSVQKSDEVVRGESVLLLPSASLLVPTTVKLEGYQKLVASPAHRFFDEKCNISVPVGSSANDVIAAVGAVLRAFVVQQTPRATILFARSFQGHLVTALLKAADGNKLAVTVKSTCEGHAVAITRDVLAIVSPGDMPPPVPVPTPTAAAEVVVEPTGEPVAVGGAGAPEPPETADVPGMLEFVPPPAPARKYLRDPSVSIDDIDPMADDTGAATPAAVAAASGVEDFLNDEEDGDGAPAAAEQPTEGARAAVVAGEEEED